ncbi:MAG: MarR family winged helix-turn-helix transcriptional regulator [Draconibacterium sp.]
MKTEKPLTYLLGQTFNLMRMKLKESFRENNMDFSMEQYIMLNLISHKNDLTQQDLANHFQKDKSLILRHVNILIEELYVNRKIDTDDKRKKILSLTSKGQTVLDLLRKTAHQVSEDLLEGVTESEKEVFQKVIQKIQNNTGQIDPLEKMENCKQ